MPTQEQQSPTIPKVEPLSPEQLRVAMKSPEHLLRWLRETNRKWVVFYAPDLLEALPFPEGVAAFMDIVAVYREHRRGIPNGRIEVQQKLDEVTQQMVDVDVELHKDEGLEIEEIDRLIRHLVGEITAKDPNWRLTNNPL